ncbi:MAG: allantoate deiminase [Gaiellales bacterium]|nr:allantoate deiminase [Gaiellales bacterium]
MSKSSSRASRTMERLRQLAEIGRVDGLQGTTRPGLGRREQRACELVAAWMAEADLEVGWDAHGNLFGGLAGTQPKAGEVWSGSHLDTVPDGGSFDGALGVLCGLEAVVANGRRPATQRVVVFRDEEGWRFGNGCFGSRAVCGRLADGELEARDAGGVSVAAALAALAIEPGGSPAGLPASYVEVHIEQGPELERQGVALGEVIAIAGMAGFAIEFAGEPGHAGTVPMSGRRDALIAAAEFVLRTRAAALSIPQAVSTVGNLRIADPAANVIPGRVSLTLDLRAPAAEALASLADDVPAIAAAAAAEAGCAEVVETTWRLPPEPMSDRVRTAIRDAATATGHPIAALPSGGGHDAGILAAAGVEAGMLFVRSRNNGASHRPDELTDEADVAAAIDVLAATLERLSMG